MSRLALTFPSVVVVRAAVAAPPYAHVAGRSSESQHEMPEGRVMTPLGINS